MHRAFVLVVMMECGVGAAWAADWPMYKGDAARTGATAEPLPAKLSLRWAVKTAQAPSPAWPVSNRLSFDWSDQPVIAGGTLYYGSSADCQVRALDAASGEERWSFFTGGPVRFAPAVWRDRVFVASDDGCLYCLAAADGKLLWKQRGGPDDGMLLGNDRMIARWPARGGPVVQDDIVYFAAGVWPSEGIYVYALEAVTGKVLWCNDKSGSIFMGQPHGGANAVSGIGAQGYLVVNEDQLLVPTGRAVPAVFDRASGRFKYFHLQAYGHKGGAGTFAIGSHFFNAGFTYDAANGKVLDPVGAGEVAALPDGLVLSTVKDVVAYKWADKTKKEKAKLELLKYKGLDKIWTIPGVSGGLAVAVAGTSVICGGDKRVTLVDMETKQATWAGDVDGKAYGLAIADGRLYVSTDRGTLYCFDASAPAKPLLRDAAPQAVTADDNSTYATAAAEIIKQSGVSEGYCLDLGCGDGGLAYALALRTKLHIVAIDADLESVLAARRKLAAAGLYGVRVTVLHGDTAQTPFPNYFADLVVSGRSVLEGTKAIATKEVARVQRPFGGVAIFGKPDALTKTVRGPLAGAGQWTHQYADPANTCCSTDALVQGPLGMLWFRDSDLDSPSRHGRGPAPLFHVGRLFVEGTHALRAVDAYNGRRLWEYPLPNVLKPYHGEHLMGTAGTHSNFCVTEDGLYVRTGQSCLRLDPATGKKLAEFDAPPAVDGKSAPWGYIASVAGRERDGKKGLLFGSLADTRHVVKYTYGRADMSQLFTESAALFALDAVSGKHQWTYTARHSIRHNAIAVGGGRVYLIDRPAAAKDLLAATDKTKEHPAGELVALEAATGREIWRIKQNVYGTLLALSAAHDVLLMSYQPTRFKLPSELGGRLAGFRASTGEPLWDVEAKYSTRPLINDRTVYAEGGAWDLLSGDTRTFTLKRSYGCGQLAGCTNLMVFRSATLGYYDLANPKVIDYGGMRPGCWINAIPAGGLVLVPDATSGCQCSYLNQAWVVLQPMN